MRLTRSALMLLLALSPAGAAAGQAVPQRLVSGRVYAADGGGVAGVWVSVRGTVSADSVRVDSTGTFALRVAAPAGDSLELAAEPEVAERLHGARLRLSPRRTTERVALVLVPRWWEIPAGSYAGTRVEIDPRRATARPCDLCGGFYRAPLGDSLPDRAPGIPVWPDSAFPLKTAIDPEMGPRISARDSVAFWRHAGELEAAFGRDLFQAASIREVLEPEDEDPHGPLLVSIDPTLRTSGWGSSAAQAGDLLAAAVMFRSAADFDRFDARGLVAHELMHALGFGHTCSWRSVVADRRCPGMRSPVATAEDVAHAQVLWRIRALERRLGIHRTVESALRALGRP